jgi:hypothetical protein
MYKTTGDKIKEFFLNLLSKYIIWIIIGIILIIWWFFPSLIDTIGKIVIFWAPAIILIVGAMIAFGRNSFRAKRDQDQGINQYDLTITKTELYLADLMVYGGSLLILIIPAVFSEAGAQPLDLVQALIYFVFTSWLKQIFYRKILQ